MCIRDSVDVVRKAQHQLRVGVRILHGDLGGRIAVRRRAREIDHIRVDQLNGALFVDVLDEARDLSLIHI